RDSIIFHERLRCLAQRFGRRLDIRHHLESEHGLPSAADLAALARPHTDREVFLCGPAGFTDIARTALVQLEIPPRRIHQEHYRSLTDNPFDHPAHPAAPTTWTGDSATATVEIDGRTHTLPWPRTRKLLDVLLDHGIDAPYVCRESACGTCVCTIRHGKTRMLTNESL
ncbi:flavin reductase family protein, partial [Nocardia gipuzkoensis]